jgi:hypothetical protein
MSQHMELYPQGALPLASKISFLVGLDMPPKLKCYCCTIFPNLLGTRWALFFKANGKITIIAYNPQ